MKVGDKVRVTPGPHWLKCLWFPKGEVTGTVQKVFKNGRVAVGVDQLRNGSEDGKQTLHFQAAELSVEPVRVLDEGFDEGRVVGQTLAEVEAMDDLDWAGAYPLVEMREAVAQRTNGLFDGFRFFDEPTQVVVSIQDASHELNKDGVAWKVIDDRYAVVWGEPVAWEDVVED